MNTEKISTRQIVLSIIIFRLSLIISYMPPIELPPRNQDIWIIVLLSIPYLIISEVPMLFLANKFKDRSMIEYFQIILGKGLGKFILILYGLYFIFNAVYGIVLQNRVVGVEMLSDTPYWIMVVPIILLSIYLGSKGLQLIFRISDLLAPIAIISTGILILLGLQNTDFSTLLPILADSTFKEINIGAFKMTFVFIDLFILIMSIPFLEDNNNINKIYGKIVVYSKLLAIIIIVVTQSSLGIQQTKHSTFPFLIYTRLINYDFLLQRIDPLYVIIWLYASVGRIIIYLYFSYLIFKNIFNIKNEKIILYIVSILTGFIALYLNNSGVRVILNSPFADMRIYFSGVFVTIIPILITIVYFFRRKSLNQCIKIQE